MSNTQQLKLKLGVGILLASLSSLSHSAICGESTSKEMCDRIQADIDLKYKPGPHNNYGRYRSFLALEANKLRENDPNIPEYIDRSPLAYGEGQLFLAVPEDKRSTVFKLPRGKVRDWLFKNADPLKVAALKRDVKAFNSLSDSQKALWMTLSVERRKEAAKLSTAWLEAFVNAHANEVSYNAKSIESVSVLLDNWKLF